MFDTCKERRQALTLLAAAAEVVFHYRFLEAKYYTYNFQVAICPECNFDESNVDLLIKCHLKQ